jgi:aspartyl-tRNA synthetase
MITKIKDLRPCEEIIEIRGWVDKIRDLKAVTFIIVRDITGMAQVSIDKETMSDLLPKIEGLTHESAIIVKGKVIDSPKVKLGGVEILPTDIEVESIAEFIPISQDSSIDQRLDYRWVDLRDPKKQLIFKVQTALVAGFREYIIKSDFIEIHSPKITGSPSESGASVFELKYFDEKAYLIQSPQFSKQMAITSGLERVFEIGPVFRAENSFTSKHTTEFTGVDIEMAHVESHEDVMRVEEEMLISGFTKVKQMYDKELKEMLGIDLIVPKAPFPRVTMDEIYDILFDEGYDIEIGEDLDSEAEKILSKYMLDKYQTPFYFITEFPTDLRCFYSMKIPSKPERTYTFDLYYKGIEITSGARREHRYEELKKNIEEKRLSTEQLQYYLDFFKFGAPSHGGFGIGLDRLTMLLLDLPTIKEAMYIFRGPTRLKP